MSNSVRILKTGITQLKADAVVNAANDGLRAGGGVCGAIFKDAGHAKLKAACDAIGHCDTGSAVITPGFDLPAKAISIMLSSGYCDGFTATASSSAFLIIIVSFQMHIPAFPLPLSGKRN